MTSEERKQNRYLRRKAKREQKREENNKYWDLFENLYNEEILFKCLEDLGKTIRHKYNYQRYYENFIRNISDLQDLIKSGLCVQDDYNRYHISERGVPRDIVSPTIKEKISQKSICNFIMKPIMIPTLIEDNGATTKGKGLNFFRIRLIKHIVYAKKHYKNPYIIKLDFKKYFRSVNKDLLLEKENPYIKDELVKQINVGYHLKSDGLGIGTELSQIDAVFYTNAIDHYIKDYLRIKCYGRYMDDSYLIIDSKEEAYRILGLIEICCREKLGLTLNKSKTKIYPLSKKFKLCKTTYVVKDNGKIIRLGGVENIKRERRRIIKMGQLIKEGKLDIINALYQYKSFRKNMIKIYNCYNKIKLLDKMVINKFGVSYKKFKKYVLK